MYHKTIKCGKNNKYLQTELKFQIDNINKAFQNSKQRRRRKLKKK